jgi:hypothetical protein
MPWLIWKSFQSMIQNLIWNKRCTPAPTCLDINKYRPAELLPNSLRPFMNGLADKGSKGSCVKVAEREAPGSRTPMRLAKRLHRAP